MAKNLYSVTCILYSEFGAEDKKNPRSNYVALMPTGYTNEQERGCRIVNDDNWFWQAPTQNK